MFSPAVKQLSKIDDAEFNVASKTLIRIASNIIKSSKEEKFRSIRIDSKAFIEKILPFDGAVQCLLEMGFMEDGDRFTLTMTNSLADLREILLQLQVAAQTKNKQTSPQVMASQETVYKRIVGHFQHSFIYENKSLQLKAKALIPFDKLKSQADVKMSRMKEPSSSSVEHLLLLELLAWFKKDFFKWMDKPKCPNCNTNSDVQNTGSVSPSNEDIIWQASTVEAYMCKNCDRVIRFPRYNHPEKLLETRSGRCGEWANCFTLMCRALNFEARHANDWSDHVWTEVFIPSWDRWVHCDPCENACDKPLLYELGWKKKLSLVVAVNSEQVIDVTMRYTVDRKAVMHRRALLFNSDWLEEKIKLINASNSSSIRPERLKELRRRWEVEKQELSSEKRMSEEYGGRTSGSLAWRLARGETSNAPGGSAPPKHDYVIEPSKSDLQKGKIKINYFSHTNEYNRPSSNDEKTYDWSSLVFVAQNIQHKEELDWKMSYLCREEGTDRAYVTWKVRLPSGFRYVKAAVRVESTTFDSGNVAWLVTTDKQTRKIETGKRENLDSFSVGDRTFSVHAVLSGGEGDCAWQKAQLFREKTEPLSSNPSFELELWFTRKS